MANSDIDSLINDQSTQYNSVLAQLRAASKKMENVNAEIENLERHASQIEQTINGLVMAKQAGNGADNQNAE